MLALILFTLLVCYFLYSYLQTYAYKNRFPNPGPTLPFLGHAHHLMNTPPSEILNVVKRLCQADPDQRKIAAVLGNNNMIWLFHPETVESLLNSNVHITKSRDYEPLLPWLGTGLLISSGEKWRHRRKLLTPAFHFKILDDSMGIFNQNADTLSELLLDEGGHGDKTLDLFPFIQRCALDIILESAMGKSLDLQHDRDSNYIRCVNDILHLVQMRQKSPWIWPDTLFKLSGWQHKQDQYLTILHGFTKQVIMEKKAAFDALDKVEQEEDLSKNKRVAFLDLLLRVKTKDGAELTHEDIQEEVDTFMFEGHDTTAAAITWTLLLLANHPEAQEKVVEEQREIYGDALEGDVEQEHLTRMKYLEAVIRESLRLYPSVPLLGRRLESDLTVDGQVVPKGASAVVFSTLLHRNPKVWTRPEEFVPERFLQGHSLEESRHPFAYVPFSAGPRNCIGQRFAMMEEKTVLSKMIRRVKLVPVDKVEDVKPVIEVITRPEGRVNMRFEAR